MHLVVYTNISLELKIITHNLLTALSECTFHVVVGCIPHHPPKSLLHTGVSYTNRMVDAVSAPVAVGPILVPERIRHLACKNIKRVNLWKFN